MRSLPINFHQAVPAATIQAKIIIPISTFANTVTFLQNILTQYQQIFGDVPKPRQQGQQQQQASDQPQPGIQ